MPENPANIPPYSLSPTDHWDGVDGNWTTFRLSIGAPNAQYFRVLVSTRGSAPWIPAPKSCPDKRPECQEMRGVENFANSPSSGFREAESKTWRNISTFDLDMEKDLGFLGSGDFGYDTVYLGHDGDNSTLMLNHTLAVATTSDEYYMGLLGIGDTKTQMAGGSAIPSFMTNLKETRKIPSSSYGYTAGARYRYGGVPGSLVLGGYDESRFEPPKLNFTFTSTTDQPLKVGIQRITTNASLTSPPIRDLLPPQSPGPLANVDSTVPDLYLPQSVCDLFEKAFGLQYDEALGLYTIDSMTHDKLVALNPALAFQLGDGNGDHNFPDENNVSITLPYAAFDLWMMSLTRNASMRYFPIRRSPSDSGNTIGRAFLQEAYLIVDHERGKFSLSQAKFDQPMPPAAIHTILPPGQTPQPNDHGLSAGLKAGIAIAAVLAFLLVVAAVLFRCWWKPRRQEKGKSRGASIATSTAPTYQEKYDQQPPGYTPLAYDNSNSNGNHSRNKSGETWVEMPAEQVERRPELEGTQSLSYELADNHEPAPVHEMEANATGENHEANAKVTDGGGKSTEKKSNKKRGRRASMVPFSSHD